MTHLNLVYVAQSVQWSPPKKIAVPTWCMNISINQTHLFAAAYRIHQIDRCCWGIRCWCLHCKKRTKFAPRDLGAVKNRDILVQDWEALPVEMRHRIPFCYPMWVSRVTCQGLSKIAETTNVRCHYFIRWNTQHRKMDPVEIIRFSLWIWLLSSFETTIF